MFKSNILLKIQGDSDKENSQTRRGASVSGVSGAGRENVINASTWLSNIMPTSKEEENMSRDVSPGATPQHRSLAFVQVQTLTILV